MNKLYQSITLTALLCAGMTLTSFADVCPGLINLGANANSFAAAKDSSVDMNTLSQCLSSCDTRYQTSNPISDATNAATCRANLSALKYGLNYDLTMNSLSPNKFSNSSLPPSLGSTTNTPMPVTTAPIQTQPVATAPMQAEQVSQHTTRYVSPKLAKTSSIRWY